MVERENATICGLPLWLPIPSNDTASFISDVVLSAINVPFCVFAFIGNLAVIIAVIKTPSLQSPCNLLLCSLATTDCLTGLIAQPIFVAWRLMIHRIHESCHHQAEMFKAFWVCQFAFIGWSFANLTVISFDCYYAITKPLQYRANVTKKDAVRAVIITGTVWLVLTILLRFILPRFYAFILVMAMGAIFFILPIVNHVVIFIAIRRHNNQVADAVSGQIVSVLFRREKKAAIDMIIVITILMLCLAPAIAVNSFEESISAEIFGLFYVWSASLVYVNSSINPVIYLVRRCEIRNAVRSMICC